jgi:hypothetical protein
LRFEGFNRCRARSISLEKWNNKQCLSLA